MGAARYVGRVGGLAVALGVGTAILGGHGMAWADTGDSGAGASSPSSSSSSARRVFGVRVARGRVGHQRRSVGNHRDHFGWCDGHDGHDRGFHHTAEEAAAQQLRGR